MAAGITEHCWTVQELLSFHVSPPRWTPPKQRSRPSLVQGNHVVEHIAVHTADQSFNRRILPQTAWGDRNLLDAHVLEPLWQCSAIDAVAIA